ncbi:hypothetical protein ACN27G_01025 [Plantactinospora sp. WMMB334]|uniref:hypothetical protein n=1 Tax=Plantactinospora sp. WMMB334 TaxID=3404119 RepID=UPI003B9382D3
MTDPSLPPTPGISWKRRADGLYLPDNHDQPPIGTAPTEGRHKVTDWLQGIGTMVAAVIAALALLVGAQTLQDQQQINRDQMALNQDARDRALRRYISRVTWRQEKDGYLIQNRSPVPMVEGHLVTPSMVVSEGKIGPNLLVRFFLAYDIPPCTAIAISAEGGPEGWMPADTSTFYFTDILGRWTLPMGMGPSPGGAPNDEQKYLVPSGYFRENARREITDCGEGG